MLNGKNILISSCAGLGDLIMFTPALRRLKELYPKCKITFMTTEPYVNILAGLSYIDKVIYIRRKKFFGRSRILKDLFQQDYVIFVDWQPQALFFSWLFRIPHRIGVPKKDHKMNYLFTKLSSYHAIKSTRYVAETNALLFGEALDINLSGDMTECDVSIPNKFEYKRVKTLLKSAGLNDDDRYVVFAPFTGFHQRDWPVDYCCALVDKIKEELNMAVILIGPATKYEVAKQIKGINLMGKTTILELIGIIQGAAVSINSDSGPLHIAGALQIPTVALFSKDLPSRWAPQRKCEILYLNMPCSPCTNEQAIQCNTLQCIKGITPVMVFDALKKQMETYYK